MVASFLIYCEVALLRYKISSYVFEVNSGRRALQQQLDFACGLITTWGLGIPRLYAINVSLCCLRAFHALIASELRSGASSAVVASGACCVGTATADCALDGHSVRPGELLQQEQMETTHLGQYARAADS